MPVESSPTDPPLRMGDRAAFPDLAARAYLHHAAIAPVALPVRRAVERALADYATHGAGAFPRWKADRVALKGALARLIGARPEEIALGTNTSRGLSDVALSIPWEKGDRVVLFHGEFPANVTPFQRAAAQFGLELVWLRADDFSSERGLDALQAELARGVRLVAVSFVQFQTGLRMPLEAIGALCARHGAELCIDAIQGVGALPFDVETMRVDYLSSGGHKWLLGMEGAAFVYVRGAKGAALRVATAGWLSHEEPERFLFEGAGLLDYERPLKTSAAVFEGGTESLLSLAALHAAVQMIEQLGVREISAHVQAYHDRLEPELIGRGFHSLRASDRGLRSGILSVLPPPAIGLVPLARALRARGIAIGTPDGHLRFAPHFANSLEEVPVVVDALDEALRECRG